MSKLIVDISSHQEAVDFAKMKQAGVDAVIIRCGYRGAKTGKLGTDPRFADNVRGAEKAGLPIGLYWYTTSLTVKEAEEEAEYCVKLAKGHKLSFPIWLDLEYYNTKREGRADHLSAKTRTACAVAFLERVKKLGYEAGVYCNPDFWKAALEPSRLNTLPRWIAHYAGEPGMDCDIWQYTSTASGSKYGVGSKYLDLNRMYTDFPAGAKSKFAAQKSEELVLSPTGNPYPAPTITVASNETADRLRLTRWIPRGEEVKAVQWELRRLEYPVGAVDGLCGTKTTAAVKEFQRAAGLTVDGACGPKTWAALVATKQRPVPSLTGGTNYRKQVAAAAKKVYPKCVGRKHGSGVQKRVTNLQQFLKQKELNCHLMVSLTLQEAGCLPKGCVITHTAKGNGKKCVSDAVKGTEKLKHCKVYWVNRLYKDLPEKYKQAGVVYIQNSNACVCAGNGKIWSCNKSVGCKYKYKGDYLRTEGYPFSSKILVVVMPDG